jgi:hypothetical protein
MSDDQQTSEERRVRAALWPGDDQVQRVVRGALGPRPKRHGPRAFQLLATGGLGVALVLAAVWWSKAPQQPALHIVGSGSLVVVTNDDGQRLIVSTRSEPNASGEYVIAVSR